MLLPSLEDVTSAKVMIDETPTQDSFARGEGPAQEMPSQELFVHSEGPVFQEAFAVVVLTHEASVRATGTTNKMSLQRWWRLVGGTEPQAVVFDRGKPERTIGQISFLWLLRTLSVPQDRLGYLKDLLDTRREVSSYPVSLYNKLHKFPLEVALGPSQSWLSWQLS